MTVYQTENIINCRALDGCRTPDGLTKAGMIVRCGIPKTPTEKDIALLRSLGVKTIIDLRGRLEVEAMPSFFEKNAEFDYHNIPLLEADPALTGKPFDLWKLYVASLENNPERYAQALHLIASLTQPFLYHCFLGKDRTGLLSALLLSCAGACEEDIYRNYECTYDLIKPFAEKEIAANTGLIWEKDVTRLKSDRINLIKTFAFLKEKYGGATAYLESIEISGEEINAIKKMLI